ncbi:BolA family protein [Maricaulis sp. MIT060901]|uniref:BolA family protein n=1 Tax=Maricaulis sp. MIT060901 TaxID=3096993 RepID=UPI0039996046
MSDVRALIESKLQAAFTPAELDVIDDSHLHAGHAGARPGGQSHFTVKIVADRFKGQTRVAIHRMINEALAEELAGPVHALAIKASAP